jgi:CBS domain-containing protein
MQEKLVKDIMNKRVLTIDASLTVKDASKMMKDANVGSVVVTENNVAVGILTERDIVRRIVSEDRILSVPVVDVMSTPLIVISPNDTVKTLANLMRLRGVHKVAVTQERLLVGMVTISDLTGACGLGPDSETSAICTELFKRRTKANL